MCSYYLIPLICFIMCPSKIVGQKMDAGAIGFPESEENPKVAHNQNRQPVYIPSTCPVNELYYPGYQKYDWICDCRPGYLYHPATDSCWLAFQRGPCPEGQYLVLPKGTVIPVCEINPCVKDNFVLWKGKCEVLGAMAPCGSTYPANVLWVNATSVNLECVQLYANNRVVTYNTQVPSCLPGCKRSINNKCMADPRR